MVPTLSAVDNDYLRSVLFRRELECEVTHEQRTASRAFFWIKIAATVVAWILLVAYLHRLAHTYQSSIVEILNSPFLRIAATTVLLTGLVYFIALSLPSVPNLGLRGVGMVLVWVTLLVLGHALSHMGFHDAQFMLFTMREAFDVVASALLVLAYGVMLAVPFLPGVELGLLIMAVLGPAGAVAAYAATLGGLLFAYAVGRALPERVVVGLLSRVGLALPREGMASAMGGMVAASGLTRSAPRRLTAFLLDHRYLTLAVCLNFPGNAALGGGGGLALLCGLSRQFGWRSFVLTVAIATSPVPILVLAGLLNVEPLMQHHGFLHDALTLIERPFIHK
jgi:hypothetical protein